MFDFDSTFNIMLILFFLIFGIVIIFFIVVGIRALTEWTRNNRQPVLSDHAQVLDKRIHVWTGSRNHRGSTSYYITFEFENGERQEFMVSGKEYGKVGQGDIGTLTYQGTRFHDFQRVQL